MTDYNTYQRQSKIATLKVKGYTVEGKPVCSSWAGSEGHPAEYCTFLRSSGFGQKFSCGYCPDMALGKWNGTELSKPHKKCPIWKDVDMDERHLRLVEALQKEGKVIKSSCRVSRLYHLIEAGDVLYQVVREDELYDDLLLRIMELCNDGPDDSWLSKEALTIISMVHDEEQDKDFWDLAKLHKGAPSLTGLSPEVKPYLKDLVDQVVRDNGRGAILSGIDSWELIIPSSIGGSFASIDRLYAYALKTTENETYKEEE